MKKDNYNRSLLISFDVNEKPVGNWIHHIKICPTEFSLNSGATATLYTLRVTDVISIGFANDVEKSQRFRINPFAIADLFPGITIELIPPASTLRAIELKIIEALNAMQEIVDL